MAGRPRSVTDTQILAAAGRAIARHGPARLTLGHVAREVGLTPATLLQRFGSKRGLLLALSAQGLAGVDAAFDRAGSEQKEPLATLRAALIGLVAGIDSRTNLANQIAFLALDLADPELHDLAARHSRALQARVRELLEQAMAAGSLVAVDGARLADAVVTTYNGALVTWALNGTGDLGSWLSNRLDFVLSPYRP